MAENVRTLALDYSEGGSALKSAVLGEPCINGGKMLRVAGNVIHEVRGRAETAEWEKRNAESYAHRLESLRKLIARMAQDLEADYRFDDTLSEKLRRDLPETGIACGGCLVNAERRGIALIPREVSAEKAERGLSRVLGKVKVERIGDVAPLWQAASFAPAPALAVVSSCVSSPTDGNTAHAAG